MSKGMKLFHAGDLNAWIWKEQSTEEEIDKSINNYISILLQIKSIHIDFDIVMFPVDSRIGSDYYIGAKIFCNTLMFVIFSYAFWVRRYTETTVKVSIRRYKNWILCKSHKRRIHLSTITIFNFPLSRNNLRTFVAYTWNHIICIIGNKTIRRFTIGIAVEGKQTVRLQWVHLKWTCISWIECSWLALQISYFNKPDPSSTVWTTLCSMKIEIVLNIVDLSTVSRAISISKFDTGESTDSR